MSKQAHKIIFTVEIPVELEREMTKKNPGYSRIDFVSETVAEFNSMKKEEDWESDLRIAEIGNGAIVSYHLEDEVLVPFNLKEEYLKLERRYRSLLKLIKDQALSNIETIVEMENKRHIDEIDS